MPTMHVVVGVQFCHHGGYFMTCDIKVKCFLGFCWDICRLYTICPLEV